MILVTGGAGFLGSALVRRLHSAGHEVRVLDDFSRGRVDRIPSEVCRLHGDIRDAQVVTRAMEGCKTVFHLAYVQGTQTFYEKPKTVIDVALKGIVNVLDACEAQGGKDLILVSSSEAYQTPPEGYFPTDETVPLSVPDVTNPRYSYGGGKIACEIAALAYSEVNTRTLIVRPHNLYGPDMGREHVIPQFAERLLSLTGEDFPIQGSGDESRSFCYIDDAVDGLMILLEKGIDREVYHLGSEAETTIRRLAEVMGHLFGREIEVKPSALPQGSPTRRLPDISKLRALGYEPKTSLVLGLVPVREWYEANT